MERLKWISDPWNRKGWSLILDIDTQGAKKAKEKQAHAIYIFLLPPSIDALQERLSGRGSRKSGQSSRRGPTPPFERLRPDGVYGQKHGAANIANLADYRRAFPVITYEDCKPLIERVMAGEVDQLLCEEPVGWAITRGTTEGESKFVPMTPTDLALRMSAGRAMMNYAASRGRYDLFDGVNLNLNFPWSEPCASADAISNTGTARGYTPGTSHL